MTLIGVGGIETAEDEDETSRRGDARPDLHSIHLRGALATGAYREGAPFVSNWTGCWAVPGEAQ
jgi:hypothetical protein